MARAGQSRSDRSGALPRRLARRERDRSPQRARTGPVGLRRVGHEPAHDGQQGRLPGGSVRSASTTQ